MLVDLKGMATTLVYTHVLRIGGAVRSRWIHGPSLRCRKAAIGERQLTA